MTSLITLFALLASDVQAPLRIGYGESRPYCYAGRDGKAAGFLVDVFDEAAKREGLKLEWTRTGSTKANTEALAEGRLDLLPMGVVTPERRRALFVSEPWWYEETILIVRAEGAADAPRKPTRLALLAPLLPGALAHYPGSQPLVVGSAPEALGSLCRNTSDAALVGSTFIRQLVNSRPDACQGVALQILDAPVTAEFSILANPRIRASAERLHRRLNELSADGTLARIAGNYPPISTPYATRMVEGLRTRYEEQRLKTLLIYVSLLLTAGLFTLLWQMRGQRRLRQALEQQRRTEQELRESQEVLRRRTDDLVRSNEDLQAFAYSVSHDLQEPVRNQALHLELLQRRNHHELSVEAAEQLTFVHANAKRMHKIVLSLLGYSRAGQPDRSRTLVNCQQLVDRVQRDLRSFLEEQGASVEVGPLPEVWGWEDRLYQVFQNLIENAAKYHRLETAVKIQVSAKQIGDEWQFSVSDNGIGFEPEHAETVFKLFKRLHNQEQYSGSGIGLALCRRVIDRHGGRIWASSRKGEGSTFHFVLPATGGPNS